MTHLLIRTLIFICLTASLSLHQSSSVTVRAGAIQECAGCASPATGNEHVLFGSYYNIRDFSASLILNNKGPNPLVVRPMVISLQGDLLDLEPIEMRGSSAEILNLNDLLAACPNRFREGSLGLRYIYEGCPLVLSAGIILEDSAAGVSYDELLARPSEFVSNQLEAVWWAPSSRSPGVKWSWFWPIGVMSQT